MSVRVINQNSKSMAAETTHKEMFKAIKAGNVERLQTIFDNLVNVKELVLSAPIDKYGYTPLELAIESETAAMVTFLLNLGFKPNPENLANAVTYSLDEIVAKLLAAGLDPNSLHYGSSLFHHVGCYGSKAKARAVTNLLIAAGSDVKSKNENEMTPLMGATCIDVAILLIEAGAEINVTDRKGKTPLMWSVNEPLIRMYLLRHGATLHDRDNQGFTALHYAVNEENYDSIIALIAAGCDINPVDDKGQTPLHHAAKQGYRTGVKLLTSLGADITVKDAKGCMARDVAYVKPKLTIDELLTFD